MVFATSCCHEYIKHGFFDSLFSILEQLPQLLLGTVLHRTWCMYPFFSKLWLLCCLHWYNSKSNNASV